MIERELPGCHLYKPEFEVYDSVEDCYMARPQLLRQLLSLLPAEKSDTAPQHILVLGGCGMGKTTLLRLFADAVRFDTQINQRWLPISLPEEQYNVIGLADFWRNCLNGLVSSLCLSGQDNQAQTLYRDMDGLGKGNESGLLDLLLIEARRTNKALVLLIDNLEHLLERLEKVHRVFFEVLQCHPELMVIGACSYQFKDGYLNYAVSENLFTVFELDRLNENDIRTTVKQIAERENNPNIAGFLAERPTRLNNLLDLSGGNPRTTMLLYPLVTLASNGDLLSSLERLLDHITPWYKARLINLTTSCQQLIDVLACNWNPVSEKHIADRLSWNQDKVAQELVQLQRHAYIRQVQSSEKVPCFYIGERFFNIWYLARISQNLVSGPNWIVCVLSCFFTPEELENHARQHLLVPPANYHDVRYTLALAAAVKIPAMSNALEHVVLRALIDKQADPHKINQLFDRHASHSCSPDKMKCIRDRIAMRKKLVKVLSDTDLMVASFCECFLGSPSFSEADRLAIIANAETLSPGRWVMLDQYLEDEAKRWRKALGSHSASLYRSIESGEMQSLIDTQGAESAAEHWQEPVLAAISWEAWISRNDKVSQQHALYTEDIYLRAIESDTELAILWDNLGNLLHLHLNRSDEAARAYRRAIDISNNPASYNNLAWLLYRQDRAFNEAIRLAKQAVKMDPTNPYSIHTLAALLVRDNDLATATPYIRSFIEHGGEEFHSSVWPDTLVLFHEIVKTGSADEALVILKESGSGDRWRPLREALTAIACNNPRHVRSIPTEIRGHTREILGCLIADNPT